MVTRDRAIAFKWYTRAADQGDTDAQYRMGMCYEEGWGVDRDSAKAVVWYERAALLGDADAQHRCGWCHDHGVGVDPDRAKAIEWYTAAADQGHADAACSAGGGLALSSRAGLSGSCAQWPWFR